MAASQLANFPTLIAALMAKLVGFDSITDFVAQKYLEKQAPASDSSEP
jgi:hypothetical protein